MDENDTNSLIIASVIGGFRLEIAFCISFERTFTVRDLSGRETFVSAIGRSRSVWC